MSNDGHSQDNAIVIDYSGHDNFPPSHVCETCTNLRSRVHELEELYQEVVFDKMLGKDITAAPLERPALARLKTNGYDSPRKANSSNLAQILPAIQDLQHAFSAGSLEGDLDSAATTWDDILRVIKDAASRIRLHQQQPPEVRADHHETGGDHEDFDIEASQGPAWNMTRVVSDESPTKRYGAPPRFDPNLEAVMSDDDVHHSEGELESDDGEQLETEASFLQQHISALSNGFSLWSSRMATLKEKNRQLRKQLECSLEDADHMEIVQVNGADNAQSKPASFSRMQTSFWKCRAAQASRMLQVFSLVMPYIRTGEHVKADFAEMTPVQSASVPVEELAEMKQALQATIVERDNLKINALICENALKITEQQCAELKRESTLLNEELSRLKKVSETVAAEGSQLLDEKQKTIVLLAEIGTERDALRLKVTELCNMTVEMDQLVLENDRLTELLAAHSQSSSEERAQIDEAHARELDQLTSKFVAVTFAKEELTRQLKETSEELARARESLQTKAQDTQSIASSYESKVKSLEAELAALTAKLSASESNKSHMESQLSLWQQESEVLSHKISHSERQIQALNADLDSSRNAVSVLTADKAELSRMMEAREQEHSSELESLSTARTNEFELVVKDFDAKMGFLQQELDARKDLEKTLMTKCSEIAGQNTVVLEEMQTKYDALLDELNNSRQELSQMQSSFEQQVRALTTSSQSLQTQLDNALAEASHDRQTLADDTAAFRKIIDSLKTKLEDAIEKSETISQENETLQKTIESARVENLALQTENQENEKLLSSIETDVQEKSKLLLEFKKNFETLEAQYKNVASDLKKASDENLRLSDQLKTASVENSRLKAAQSLSASNSRTTTPVANNAASKRPLADDAEKENRSKPNSKRRSIGPAAKNSELAASEQHQVTAKKERVTSQSLVNESPFVCNLDRSAGRKLSHVEVSENSQTSTQNSIPDYGIRRSSRKVQPQRVVVSFSGFRDDLPNYTLSVKAELIAKLKMLGASVKLDGEFEEKITHVIVPPSCRTLKTFAAALTGKWLITDNDWIMESAKQESFVPEDSYGRKFSETPFKGMKMFIAPSFLAESRNGKEFRIENAKNLVGVLGKGEMVSTLAECDAVLKAATDKESYAGKRSFTWTEFLDLIPICSAKTK